MKFNSPLITGTLLKRYKRFMADVQLEGGDIITAHCANPGAMLGLKEPGMTVHLSKSDNPKRKLQYSWEMVEAGPPGNFVGINTSHPNKLAEEAIRDGKIPEFKGYATIKREVKYGANSRIDLLLEDHPERPGERCYVEVKNVHLLRVEQLAEFPDSVTARGTKHLKELTDMVTAGQRAAMLYVIQRADANNFTIAADIDPAYHHAFKAAREGGVEAYAYGCCLTKDEIILSHEVGII